MSDATYDTSQSDRTAPGGLPATLNRVAEVTIAFRIMKILATTLAVLGAVLWISTRRGSAEPGRIPE